MSTYSEHHTSDIPTAQDYLGDNSQPDRQSVTDVELTRIEWRRHCLLTTRRPLATHRTERRHEDTTGLHVTAIQDITGHSRHGVSRPF